MSNGKLSDYLLSYDEYKALTSQIEAYRLALKKSNEWLLYHEGIDLCESIDDKETKVLVRGLLDNIMSEPKPR